MHKKSLNLSIPKAACLLGFVLLVGVLISSISLFSSVRRSQDQKAKTSPLIKKRADPMTLVKESRFRLPSVNTSQDQPLDLAELTTLNELVSELNQRFMEIEHSQGRLIYNVESEDSLTSVTVFPEPVNEVIEKYAGIATIILGKAEMNARLYPRVRKQVEQRMKEYTSYPAPFKIVRAELDPNTGSGRILEGFNKSEPVVGADGAVAISHGSTVSAALDQMTWGNRRYGYMFSGLK